MHAPMKNDHDSEFRRHMKIIRPHLGRLNDQNVLDICNAWTQKLTSEKDKALRNKYLFYLCYQLANGEICEPFTTPPPVSLLPIDFEKDLSESDASFGHELLVTEEDKTNVWVNHNSRAHSTSVTDYLSHEVVSCSYEGYDFKANSDSLENIQENSTKPMPSFQTDLYKDNTWLTSNSMHDFKNNFVPRTNKIIQKLREIKKHNVLLSNELAALKEQTRHKEYNDNCRFSECNDTVKKVDGSTSDCFQCEETSHTLIEKIIELQKSVNIMVKTISDQQETIEKLNKAKKAEIEELISYHELELVKLKSIVREEAKQSYDTQLTEIKNFYENKIEEINFKNDFNLKEVVKDKNMLIEEKEKLIIENKSAIKRLEDSVTEYKYMLNANMTNQPQKNEDISCVEALKSRVQHLEKKLMKVVKSKNEKTKAFQTKLALLEQEKYLHECSFQLQLVRQRAQIASELAEGNQTEIKSTIDNLESQYKSIVANVQAAALNRRMQDQISLESVLQATLSMSSKTESCNQHVNYQKPNKSQFNTCNLVSDNGKCEIDLNETHHNTEMSSLFYLNKNRPNNVSENKKSIEYDGDIPKYCLKSKELFEFYDKIYLPQKDCGDVEK